MTATPYVRQTLWQRRSGPGPDSKSRAPFSANGVPPSSARPAPFGSSGNLAAPGVLLDQGEMPTKIGVWRLLRPPSAQPTGPQLGRQLEVFKWKQRGRLPSFWKTN